MTIFKTTKTLTFVTCLAIITLVSSIYWLYSNAKIKLYHDALSSHQQTLEHEINRLVEDRRESAMAVALALSESQQVRDFLCKTCEVEKPSQLDFKDLLEQLALHTDYNQLWIQVLDTKGVSRYRSWTPKTGDSLIEARRDVRDILHVPRVVQEISVGKFNLTFKSMVPLWDEQQTLLGLVEIVSHFTPLANKLKRIHGVDSVILVEKRYRDQLTKAQTGVFVNDYHVANSGTNPKYVAFLERLGAQGIAGGIPEKVYENHVITRHLIKDDTGLILGYWFTFEPIEKLGFSEIEHLNKQYLYASIVLLVLTLLLIFLYIFKQRSDKGLSYYRHVLNSASEIIFVSDYSRIIEANQQFFEFYSEFSTLKEFLSKYRCVCDTFEVEKGYLQREVDGEFWLDYVVRLPDKHHKAVILKDGKKQFFEVKVAQIDIYDKPLYSVIMHNITSQEVYKQQLELLSETDTLTGISNRLVFNRTLVQEIQRAHRYHSELALLMFDIDHFKNVNDTYGHEVGDQVLVTLCEIISELLRETDVFCRIGGEEFTVVMPETSLEQATQTAERLRKAIETLPSETLPTSLTVSFGVVSMTRWDNDKTILKRVDDALYQAKKNGRNRVEVAEDSVATTNQ
ncbi:sensor domain-containing diguanylate cyclase [Thiomicrorhabdus lithotrophica]|uniref:diguanylate cyclase n=1 Tax=Thiomicrorhabdus lithotrophica TaxID=2949997 RepID=A0ABY8C8R7_9GAMM|nr:diguanylate cyclase [Thiomicrorhabdus lithotrophica]WEJ62350.1 diguanylate cyclase [Thiomicrorhabdus lithotrophica]